MKITYSQFMSMLENMWNYKYHNVNNSIVEPYPNNLAPSQIYKELRPRHHIENEDELLFHADHIHSNNRLKGYKPFRAVFLFNNSKPFEAKLYAQSEYAAKKLAINKFSDYLKTNNSNLFKPSTINLGLSNGTIILKLNEI